MTRALLLAASILSCCAAPGQAAPRDGRVQQAIADTVAANLQARGFNPSEPKHVDTTNAVNAMIIDLTMAGLQLQQPAAAASSATFRQVVQALLGTDLVAPFNLGRGGGYGGGGNTSDSWDDWTCDDIDWKLDYAGNLVIPSMPLSMGAAIKINDPIFGQTCPVVAGAVCTNSGHPWYVTEEITASSASALARRAMHLTNMNRPDKRNWFGVVSQNGNCVVGATVAWSGAPQRGTFNYCASQGVHGEIYVNENHPEQHVPCPPSGGGVLHFYGSSTSLLHLHTCIAYQPNYTLSPDGYAINPQTSIPITTGAWPTYAPERYKQCPIDPELIRKIADAAYRRAAEKPGFTGHPHVPITPEQARPGDTTVEDLGDNPTAGTQPTKPNPTDVGQPPPTTTAPGGGGTDLGPDPQTGAPSLDEPPTGIMDPIFDWLPDLPSINLNANNSQCPVWMIDASAFGGTEWQWLMDAHCDVAEQNAAAISALMIALFGIGAGLIILRA